MPCALILTSLQIEYISVRALLTDPQEEILPYGIVYERGQFAGDNQSWEVAIIEIASSQPDAAFEAGRAINHFNPDLVLFVGVAGGIRHVALGDVVVSTKVYSYNSPKEAHTFKLRPEIGLSTYHLEQLARVEASKNNWLERLPHTIKLHPRVFIGPIAAGECIIDSVKSKFFNFLQTNYENAIAVEMEGLGLLEAARRNQQAPTIILRGIFDLIDHPHESAAIDHQKIAAQNASAFAFELISKCQSVSPKQHSILKVLERPKPMSTPPVKVFISYSHDSTRHIERVLELANRLREDGIDCNIDLYEDSPDIGWPRWMIDQIESANFVLVICTQEYDRRFRGHEEPDRGRGASWEGAIILQELYTAQGKNSKFLPVTMAKNDFRFIPRPLDSGTAYKVYLETGYQSLLRRLTQILHLSREGIANRVKIWEKGRNNTF
jgi:nucleoside phosphorylase